MTTSIDSLSDKVNVSIPNLIPSPSAGKDTSTNFTEAQESKTVPIESSIPIAINPISLITSECISVTSAMRKHARWAHSSVAAILGGGNAAKALERSALLRGAALLPSASITDEEQSLGSRWGLRGKKGKSMQDNPLMSAFTRLRVDLRDCKDIRTFDTPTLLHPFLQVIRSSSTSAPITSLALVAITKFFSYDIITKNSPRLSLALQLLSAAITHCRFEASDSADDEVVLLRILKLMESMLSRPEGELLGDESVCEMMETGLSMCCQVRLSEVLRRSAEMAMVSMCQVIFQRLSHLKVEDVPVTSTQNQSLDELSAVKMDPSVDGNTVTSQNPSSLGSDTISIEKEAGSGTTNPSALQHDPHDELFPEVKPYSIPSIRELFRVLIDLLDPHNPQHTNTMRIMSLRIIDVALEVAGPAIASHHSLAQLAKDDLCRHLFQLVRSDNMELLNGSLRVAGTLLETCRHVIKLQQELYLSYLVACLHPRVAIPPEPGIDPELYQGVPEVPKLVKPPPSQPSSGRSTPVPIKDRQKLGMEGGSRKPEAREAMVESIGTLCRIPSFMAELFVNYDCSVNRADLCEDMIGLLSRNAFPDSATWSTTNVPPLCLDALLGYVQFMAERLDQDPVGPVYPDPDTLKYQRERKRIVIRGATKFNENPKDGISYLASQGIIQDIHDQKLIARFLRGTNRVSKKVLGDYISKQSHEEMLNEFIRLLDFTGKNVVEALRELLGAFRLPGESPLISRILTAFSEIYMDQCQPKEIADEDSVFVLTYAIVMLNTNLYNPNVRASDRMTFPAFVKNLRGVNAGGNFAEDFLHMIYTSIERDEIILPDEHENKNAFDYAWKELLQKAEHAGDLAPCTTNAFDAEMFKATWKPVIATLTFVFMSATDDSVFFRVIIGFGQCAKIAAKYGLTEVIDRIIFCLGSISTLASDTPLNTSLNTEVQIEDKKVMVSELAVRLGRDFRAQLATVVLFRLLVGSEAIVRNGWAYIVRILNKLFVNSLIPQFENLDIKLDIPPIPLQNPSLFIDRNHRNNDTGFFSAVTSYITGYAADDPPEPSDEELENTSSAVDCISACSIPKILANISAMPIESVTSFVNALLERLPETSPDVIIVKSEPLSPGGRSFGNKIDNDGPNYDPAMLYMLELATILALRDEVTIQELGENLTAALQNIIRDANNVHPLIMSRSISYLLEVMCRSYEYTFIRAPVVLHSIASFDQGMLERHALPIVKGLSKCIDTAVPLRNELTSSPDLWSIMQRLHRHENGAPMVFELLRALVEVYPQAITADNYESAVALAADFASAGAERPSEDQPVRRPRVQAQTSKSKQPQSPFVVRGTKAISLIYHLTGRVPTLIEQSHLEKNEAWATYWSPIFNALTTQSINPSRNIRHQALSSLQRSLLLPQLASTDRTEWVAIFGEVLFPLVGRLLKPEIYQSDPRGMGETRAQAAMLVCKIFLHYLVLLSEWDGMLDLWLKILDVLDRMMNSGQGESLEEAVPESIKNILLVMADGGYVAPLSKDPSKKTLWVETQKRLDRFLPNLWSDIFPEPEKPVQTSGSEEASGAVDESGKTEKENQVDVATPEEEKA